MLSGAIMDRKEDIVTMTEVENLVKLSELMKLAIITVKLTKYTIYDLRISTCWKLSTSVKRSKS